MNKLPVFLFFTLALISGTCQENPAPKDNQKAMKPASGKYQYTNDLIKESSPYLLQHAHNPVNWHAWNEASLEQAKKENKIMIISIGYSACHWCHVMEHESFEDEEVAAIMNEHFYCIKVDREERPDVDQVYMNAVQFISGQGGWPLNCFALPDGRPFYGGTYFSKKNWVTLLENLLKEYEANKDKIEEYADRLVAGIKGPEDLIPNHIEYKDRNLLDTTVAKWKPLFDLTYGGMDRSPKFPLPNNYEFLMEYGWFTNDVEVNSHVEITLDQMAFGGIYDHLGGGFARYSTDQFWKVPHFEKMLYDNAQMVSLYAKGYRRFKKQLYKDVVFETLNFVERELANGKGGYFAALDADSEGEEGAYYVWKEEELSKIAGTDFPFLKLWFNINNRDVWEDGKFVLHRTASDAELMKEFDLDVAGLQAKKDKLKKALLNARKKRERPGTDDKTLTAWNALMISAYTEAYKTFGEEDHLKKALDCANFLWNNQHSPEGYLFRTYKNGKSAISAFMEDYSLVIKAFADLYEVSMDEQWLQRANELTGYCFQHFYKRNNNFFYFAPKESELIARNVDLMDNVICSSNSVMATSLFQIGTYLDSSKYLEISQKMLDNIAPYIAEYGSSYSNWCILMLKSAYGHKEVAVCGEHSAEIIKELSKHFFPNVLLQGGEKDSRLPLMENKFISGKTMIYVCENKTCKLPVESVDQALKQIGSK